LILGRDLGIPILNSTTTTPRGENALQRGMRIINGKALKTTDYQDQVEPEEEGDRAEQEGLQEGGGPTVEVPAVLCTNVSTFYSLVKIIINFYPF